MAWGDGVGGDEVKKSSSFPTPILQLFFLSQSLLPNPFIFEASPSCGSMALSCIGIVKWGQYPTVKGWSTPKHYVYVQTTTTSSSFQKYFFKKKKQTSPTKSSMAHLRYGIFWVPNYHLKTSVPMTENLKGGIWKLGTKTIPIRFALPWVLFPGYYCVTNFGRTAHKSG